MESTIEKASRSQVRERDDSETLAECGKNRDANVLSFFGSSILASETLVETTMSRPRIPVGTTATDLHVAATTRRPYS